MAPQSGTNETRRDKGPKKAGNGRKRRRESQPGTELLLPDIPGIPLEILPLHVQALNTSFHFFRRAGYKFISPIEGPGTNGEDSSEVQDDSNGAVRGGTTGSNGRSQKRDNGTVLDVVLDRLSQTAAQAQAQSESGRGFTELLRRKDHAIEAWLQAIRQWLRQNQKTAKSDSTQAQVDNGASGAVPIAILKHFMDNIIPEDSQKAGSNKSVVLLNVRRRGSTHLMGRLLSKSSDCRRWLFEASSETLVSWMDTVAAASTKTNENDILEVRLWQRESFVILQQLAFQFDDLYPKLTVAVQRFEQLCPLVQSAEPTESSAVGNDDNPAPTLRVVPNSHGISDASSYRATRDAALSNASGLERRARKLVAQANAYIDFLVPRVTDAPIQAMPNMSSSATSTVDATFLATSSATMHPSSFGDGKDTDDEDDDDAVDWEDGLDDDFVLEQKPPARTEVSHAVAVELTLAVMKHTGGLTGGELEIDFAAPPPLPPPDSSDVAQGQDQSETIAGIRERLQGVARVLEQRYMTRLSLWMEALSQADHLVGVTKEQKCAAAGGIGVASQAAVALVSMSRAEIQRRNDVFHLVQTLKLDVASVLSSVRRLGLNNNGNSTSSDNNSGSRTDGVSSTLHRNELRRTPGLLISQGRNPALLANINRRRDVKRTTNIPHKRNRIQIKYRKD
jgi:hypothetical protein